MKKNSSAQDSTTVSLQDPAYYYCPQLLKYLFLTEVPMDLEREPGDGEVDDSDVQQGSSQGGAQPHNWGTGNTLQPGDTPGGGNVDESDGKNKRHRLTEGELAQPLYKL